MKFHCSTLQEDEICLQYYPCRRKPERMVEKVERRKVEENKGEKMTDKERETE